MVARKHILQVLVEFLSARGVRRLDLLPGCYELQIDGAWWLAANGRAEPTRCSRDVVVPPRGFYVEREGTPFLLVNPTGGSVVGGSDELLRRALLDAS